MKLPGSNLSHVGHNLIEHFGCSFGLANGCRIAKGKPQAFFAFGLIEAASGQNVAWFDRTGRASGPTTAADALAIQTNQNRLCANPRNSQMAYPGG